MKRTIICLFFLVFLFSYKNVHANSCSSQDINTYMKMIDNIKISYEYMDNSEIQNRFSIIISNIPKEIKIYETKASYAFINNTNDTYTTIKQDNFDGGITTKFLFYTTENTKCPDLKLKQENIKLPVYNKYWQDELCRGIEEYIYCHKVIEHEITYEGFKKHVIEYKEKIETSEIIEEDESTTIIDQIKNFVSKNKTILIFSSISLIVTMVIIYTLKHKKEVK